MEESGKKLVLPGIDLLSPHMPEWMFSVDAKKVEEVRFQQVRREHSPH